MKNLGIGVILVATVLIVIVIVILPHNPVLPEDDNNLDSFQTPLTPELSPDSSGNVVNPLFLNVNAYSKTTAHNQDNGEKSKIRHRSHLILIK
ncbi:hypothetical protein [Methanobacterium petrolearium]|uniref:hypothetical protein n=1 Tax=Methanobacterium petrolearium TaxID=710190 RepID=UPI0030814388|nr:hypothetical protein GCM10025861_07390 [Methanobacterium petrolearium]